MKLAIMQPYFLPYIGYWQLINAVDLFIVLDDVNYITRGWIGRNRILCDRKEHYLINPVKNRSQNKKICQTEFINDFKYMNNMIKTIKYAYRGAPYLSERLELISDVILKNETNVSLYLTQQIKDICTYLDIKTEIRFASQFRKMNINTGWRGILELCNYSNYKEYINPIGGINIYDRDAFLQSGIHIRFLKTDYERISNKIKMTNLDYSIIHLLVNCSKEEIRDSLQDYVFL